MRDVGIIGYSIDGFQSSIAGRGDEVIFPVVRSALDQADLTREDIDSVINCGHDAYSGQTISNGVTACPSGGYQKSTIRTQNGGIYALHQAVAQIRSEKADVVVVATEDTVDCDRATVSNASQESLLEQPLGVNFLHTHALLAQYHLETRDVTKEDYASVAAKNYRAAADNPHADRQEAHSTDDILDSDIRVSPFPELTVGPSSKGAVALVLASEEVAADVDVAAWIDGVGVSSSRYRIHDMEERLRLPALQAAAQSAYDGAGIDDPRSEVDAVELYNPIAYLELLGYEALGLCEPDEGGELHRDGVTDVDGDLPVNPSGGALATNPLNSTGLLRTVQATMLLDGTMELPGTDSIETTVATDSDLMLGESGCTDGVAVLGGAN